MNRLFFFAVIFLCNSAISFGNAPPLPITPFRYIIPEVQFLGVDKYPETIFILRYQTYYEIPQSHYLLLEVKNEKKFQLPTARYYYNMKLLAMNREEYQKQKPKNDENWPTDKSPGFLNTLVIPPKNFVPFLEKNPPPTRYHITIKEGKLKVEMLDLPWQKDARLPGLLPLWAFGIAASVSFIYFGMWFLRKKAAP